MLHKTIREMTALALTPWYYSTMTAYFLTVGVIEAVKQIRKAN